MNDLVWIRGTAEVTAVAGVDDVVVFVPIRRAEWDRLTGDQRDELLDEVGRSALEQVAGYGASVVDESEVPESER